MIEGASLRGILEQNQLEGRLRHREVGIASPQLDWSGLKELAVEGHRLVEVADVERQLNPGHGQQGPPQQLSQGQSQAMVRSPISMAVDVSCSGCCRLDRHLSMYEAQKAATSAVTLSDFEAPERTKGCCQPVAPPIAADQASELAALLKTLGDPTRVQIIHILAAASGPVCVCDFTAAFELGQPTISHHLAKLREAGQVTCLKRGLWAFYQLNPEMSARASLAVSLIP